MPLYYPETPCRRAFALATTRPTRQSISSYTIGYMYLTIYIFSFNRYETSDGTYRREEGGVVPGPDGGAWVVRGEYGYIDSRGKPYSMKYVADANGYQPRINDDHTRFNDRRII
ncbi:cuticular protein R-1 [Spodoptera litura]|uniref:Cuticular protein R-1 n=1 Tax=Spodoptera litura TaxID=69820 RepID=A0A4U7BFG6_SPOLT|nr:cuticular protein R-1 [Spodoptera litura]